MRRRLDCLALICLTFWLLPQHPVIGGQVLTPVQSQSTSPPGVLVPTNWGPGTTGVTNPLVFNQFNPNLGTLTSVDVTMTTTVRNDYELKFVTTPVPTTIFVATSQTSDPSVLTDPTKRALLTDGPTVTLYGPNGTTQIFGAPGTRQPVDFVQLTESSGTWSSLLPVTSPNYIAPTMTEQSFALGLTASSAPSLFSDFIGTGQVDLPVTASAFSSFFTSSGNGGGAVLTAANAQVTVQYEYLAAPVVPEPSSGILLGLGIGFSALASRYRIHRFNISKSNRS